MGDGGADDFVAPADCEGLGGVRFAGGKVFEGGNLMSGWGDGCVSVKL